MENISGDPDNEENYRLIAGLADHGAQLARSRALPSLTEIAERLAALGLDIAAADEAAIAAGLKTPEGVGLIIDAERQAADLDTLIDAEAKAKEAIHKATNSGNYDLLSELGLRAKKATDDLGTLRDAYAVTLRQLTQARHATPPGSAPDSETEVPADRDGASGPTHPRLAALGPRAVGAKPAKRSAGQAERDTPPAPQPIDAETVVDAAGNAPVAASVATDTSITSVATSAIKTVAAGDGVSEAADTTPAPLKGDFPESAGPETAGLEATASKAVVAEVAGEDGEGEAAEDPASHILLADLLDRDLLGIASDAATALEANGEAWPIHASVLRAAAAARAPHRDYGGDATAFTAIVDLARTTVDNDLDAVVLLGALLRPTILMKNPTFRKGVADLSRGRLGQHPNEVVDAITELPYDFPPSSDDLARLAGASHPA